MGKFDFLCRFAGRKAPVIPLQQFNKAGNRIVSKEILPLNSRALKKTDIPLNTKLAERLVVEKQFGDKSVEIISFKDENGNLLSRLRKNYTSGELTDYASSRYLRGKSRINKIGEGLIRVGDKQVQHFSPDGVLQQMDRIRTDIVKLDNETGKHITRMRYNSSLNANGNFDGQFSVYHKYADEITKEINMNVTHSANGELLNKHINQAKNISDKLLKDPYLIMRAMPEEFAIKNLVNRFLKIFNHSDKNLNLYFNKAKDALYEGEHYNHEYNRMYASLMSDLSCDVNMVSHELRHKKQYEYADKFWKQFWYKITNSKKYDKREFQLASHFYWQDIKYRVLPQDYTAKENSIMFKLYRNNGLEVDAYNKGLRYEIDYQNRSKEFYEHFPYTSKYSRGTVGSTQFESQSNTKK